MKNTKLIIFITLVIFIGFSSLTIDNSQKDKYTSIEKLFKSGNLQTVIKGLGGYQEECIEFDLQNNTNDTLFIEIEPGRRLISKDTSIQDIFIVKKKRFKLFPRKKTKIKGYGFCCQSNNHAPYKDADFNLGHMAPDDWVKVAELIDKNNYPAGAIQSAVWVMSDNHTLSSVNAEDLASIYDLRKTIAELKGIEIPWYALTYEQDTARLFSGRHEKVLGNFKYRVKNNSVINITLRNKQGEIIKKLIKQEAKGPGEYTYQLDLDVRNWPKGEYGIYVYQDYSKLIKRKTFVL